MRPNTTQDGQRVPSFPRYGGNGGKSLEVCFDFILFSSLFNSHSRKPAPVTPVSRSPTARRSTREALFLRTKEPRGFRRATRNPRHNERKLDQWKHKTQSPKHSTALPTPSRSSRGFTPHNSKSTAAHARQSPASLVQSKRQTGWCDTHLRTEDTEGSAHVPAARPSQRHPTKLPARAGHPEEEPAFAPLDLFAPPHTVARNFRLVLREARGG